MRGSFLLLALGAAMLPACSRVHGPEDVTGRYVLNQGRASDVLELRPDGTYVHRYTPPSGPAVVDSSSWELVNQNGRAQLEFEKFSHYARRELSPGEQVLRGWWIVTVDAGWTGRLQLVVDSDIGLRYVRE